ncbi:FAD-binding oxidoreductase [Streptomyces sp. NPDC013178]|uniref:FAD-binding oxidoreductase n=1 Tax=Streptomyces sp. NPDC013178 TaxID=3155118 RepID=UPI0033D3594D
MTPAADALTPVQQSALSAPARDAVADSLRLVGDAIQDIANEMYTTMFREDPDLLRRLFNRGNQITGDQQAALATGLAGFAALLVHRPYIEIRTVLERIAHKHVSVGVAPEQYQLVHRHLMAAFRTVLGSAATDRLIVGWSEVYWVMAHALLEREAQLCRGLGIEPGRHWRSWRVVQRTTEARNVLSLLLEPADEWPADDFLPGQYVSVAVPVDTDSFQIRQYSVSCEPGDGRLRITVERARRRGRPDGEVSAFLHEKAQLGTRVRLSPPCGELVLDDSERPVLFVSQGVGVTPFVSMIKHLARTGSGRPVTHVHLDTHVLDHPHRFEIELALRQLPGARSLLVYDDIKWAPPEAIASPLDFQQLAPAPDTLAYLCGPTSFLSHTRAALVRAGVAPDSIRYEVFGPQLWSAPS